MDDGSAATGGCALASIRRDAAIAALNVSGKRNVTAIGTKRPCEGHFLFATFSLGT